MSSRAARIWVDSTRAPGAPNIGGFLPPFDDEYFCKEEAMGVQLGRGLD